MGCTQSGGVSSGKPVTEAQKKIIKDVAFFNMLSVAQVDQIGKNFTSTPYQPGVRLITPSLRPSVVGMGAQKDGCVGMGG